MFGIGNIKSTVLKTLTGSHTVSGLGVVALGKPYIKLEFDDNEALVDFQKRIQPSGEAEPVEFRDGEFYPIEGVKMLSEKDFYNLIEREPKYINLDSEKYNYTNNKIKPITDSNGIIKSAYSFRTPIDEIFCWTDFFHIVSGNSSHQDRTRILPLIKPTLEDPNCIFETGKENYFIKPFITEKGVKIIFAFIPTLKENSRVKTLFERPKKEIYNLYTKGGGNLYQKFDILDGSTTLNGVANQSKPFKVVEFRLPCKVDYYFSDNQIFNKNLGALNGYGDKYTVIDNRKRAKKEPGELVANKNLVFTKEVSNSITNYNHTVINNPDYKEITILFQSQQYETHFPFFHVTKKARKETHSTQTGKDGQLYDGHIVYIKVPVEVEKLYNFDRNSHTAYIPLSYYKDLKNKAFKQFLQSWQNTFNNYKEQIKKIKTNTYLNASTKESWIKEQKEYLNDALKVYKYNCDFYGIENDSEKEINLGAPGDVYLVTDTRNNPRKDLSKMSTFQKFDTRKLNVENLQKMSEDDPLLYEEIKSGLGMFLPDESLDGLTVNDQPAAVFNCPEAFLQTKGFTPTYIRLDDYSALIEPATGEKRLVGYGFEGATLDQLKNACKNYPQVAKLAAHLKGDTELQSAFNVWHWLHTNIKYNYDAPGQEEIRTPARTFADRESGVDCDCLAVFAACLLGAMGYKPRFEIVAFGNSPKFSHIYVNLNGAAVDRVLPVFLARPSGITKTKIMEIPVFELSGGSAMEAAATLNGIYESALAKVQAHEATAEDSADLRKSQILMTLQNSDPQAYRLAAILMPHVVAIDDDGAWYFADAKVAEIADKADKKLYELKISEVNENIFNDFFNDILNEFKNISVKVERGDGKTVLTISFTNPANDIVTVSGDYVKKDFIALNPNFLTMRESLKNLLAVNYLGLASKYAVGLMTEQEAVAAGYSVETWKKAVKAFETLTRFWILIGGKAENIADIILNGSAKEPLTDKNINYEANIVATSDTDAILSGCKKRGLSGLNGLGETPTVASDIENLGEEGLEKILDWCSDIETEEEKAAENSDENPVNVLAENATPAAAASSAPAATETKKKSLIWWLLGGAALGGGIAAATGGKKNKRRK